MRGLLGMDVAAAVLGVLIGTGGCAPSAASGADAAAPPDLAAAEGKVRSALYPADWTPSFRDAQGRFLHDVSYAGYKNGELALPLSPPGLTYDVVAKYGADPKGGKDSTAAIQSALDAAAAAGGGVVFLPAGLYRCDGLLDVSRSGVVLRGAGAAQSRIYFTRAQGMTDLSHVTFHGSVAAGPLVPLAQEGASQSFEVRLADAGTLAVGDDVSVGWVITPAFVEEHGMTGTWTVFLNQWKPFFRRQIRAIDRTVTPHRVTLDVPLRYPAKLRDQAALRRETGYLTGVGVESLGLASAVAWSDAWKSLRSHVLGFGAVKDGWIRGVESFVPPTPGAEMYHLQNGGLVIKDSKRVTVADTRLENAQNRGDGGCGYLFEISTSSEVLVRDSVGRNGRHNFIQNWDFGTTGLVFLRCLTEGSRIVYSETLPLTYPAASEYHHSLTMACLVDSATIRDTWSALNRGSESSGAGHTATQDVFWNSGGSASGLVRSLQYGLGYVIGTQSVQVDTSLTSSGGAGSAPEDFVELQDRGEQLDPPSLYEDQLQRRLQRGERLW
ncbi:MAG: glycosyl hydrolase family 28-related protein [Polyangia bacterium]